MLTTACNIPKAAPATGLLYSKRSVKLSIARNVLAAADGGSLASGERWLDRFRSIDSKSFLLGNRRMKPWIKGEHLLHPHAICAGGGRHGQD
jgi:hypothetical protein